MPDATPSEVVRVFVSYRSTDDARLRARVMSALEDDGLAVVTDEDPVVIFPADDPLGFFFVDTFCAAQIRASDVVVHVVESYTPLGTQLPDGWCRRVRRALSVERMLTSFSETFDLGSRVRIELRRCDYWIDRCRGWWTSRFGPPRGSYVWPLQRFAGGCLGVVLLPLLVVLGPLLLVVAFVTRAVRNFSSRHLHGRAITKQPDESWAAWEGRVAGEYGRPLIVVERSPDGYVLTEPDGNSTVLRSDDELSQVSRAVRRQQPGTAVDRGLTFELRTYLALVGGGTVAASAALVLAAAGLAVFLRRIGSRRVALGGAALGAALVLHRVLQVWREPHGGRVRRAPLGRGPR